MDVEACRAKAAVFLKKAEEAIDSDTKAIFREIAQQWLDIGIELERLGRQLSVEASKIGPGPSSIS